MFNKIDEIKAQIWTAVDAKDLKKVGELVHRLSIAWPDGGEDAAAFLKQVNDAVTGGRVPAKPAAKRPAMKLARNQPSPRKLARQAAADAAAKAKAKPEAAKPEAPAAKPAKPATPAKPAKAAKGADVPVPAVRFAKAYTKTYRAILVPHGFTQVPAAEPASLMFANGKTTVTVAIPAKAGAPAPYVVDRNGKREQGAGRDALADLLKLPRYQARKAA